MNKTFQEMYTNVSLDVQDTSANMITLIKNYCNRRYNQILKLFNFDLRRPDYTFSSASGQQDYTVPNDFGRAVFCFDTTNKRELAETDYSISVQNNQSSVGTSGTATQFSVFTDAVQAQPTSAVVLSVISSDASDTSQQVFVRGLVGGSETTETITLTGTTASTGSKLFSRVISITKTASTAGYVTVTAGTATVAIIDPERTLFSCKKLRLFPTPNAVTSYSVPYYIEPQKMVSNYDFPAVDCADCIEAGARADAWRYKRQMQKAQIEELNFRTLTGELIHYQENKPNKVVQFLPTANAQAYDRDATI